MSLARNRKLLLAFVYVAGYLILSWLCHARPVLAPGITPWHPQAGLTLAFLVICGPAWWALTFLSTLLSEMLIRHSPIAQWAVIAAALWTAAVFALLAIYIRRLLGDATLRTTQQCAKFSFSAALMTLIGAAGFVGFFVAVADVPPAEALRGMARYWFADLNGVLMVTPVLLSIQRRQADGGSWHFQQAEIFAQLALVLALLVGIFALPDDEQLRFLYLLFVPVIWIALRWNWRGALPAVGVIQAATYFRGRGRHSHSAIHRPAVPDAHIESHGAVAGLGGGRAEGVRNWNCASARPLSRAPCALRWPANWLRH